MLEEDIENWISTTIKKKYLDKILEGEKTIEYKKGSEFWKKRLEKHLGVFKSGSLGINFLCGQKTYKFDVLQVIHISNRLKEIEIDGEKVDDYYKIYIGERLDTKSNRNQNGGEKEC